MKLILPLYLHSEGENDYLIKSYTFDNFFKTWNSLKISGTDKIQYFLEEGTVEFSNNNLIILSSSIIEMSALSKEK